MNNCEIVDNVACGVAFQYCRTHKVEPHNCPGVKEPDSGPGDFANALSYALAAKLIAPQTKREFKVGDKVRIVDPGVHTHLLNAITTIQEIDSSSFDDAPFICDARSARGYLVCWGPEHLGHV